LKRGGGFALSDDSHGVDHVATNYGRIPAFLAETGITHLYAMQRVQSTTAENPASEFEFVKHEVEAVSAMEFWGNA
jgi:histidinol-phosphatase (PHP family)